MPVTRTVVAAYASFSSRLAMPSASVMATQKGSVAAASSRGSEPQDARRNPPDFSLPGAPLPGRRRGGR
jgi:hypothetical protein